MSRSASADPSPGRRLAIRILDRVERAGAYASILLRGPDARRLDPREIGLLQETVLGVLRNRASLDHAIDRCSRRSPGRVDPIVRTILRVAAYEQLFLDGIPDYASVDAAVRLVRDAGSARSAGFVNAVARAVARGGRALLPGEPDRGDVEALALYGSHPSWWIARRVERCGWDATLALVEADNRPAPTVVRLVGPGGIGLEQRLEREGVRARPCRVAPAGLEVTAGAGSLETFLDDGSLVIQDEASQLVPLLLGTPGPRVADLCAAPGSKTFQIVEGLAAGGFIVAADRHHGRLKRLTRRASALGVRAIAALQADIGQAALPFASRFDQVLLDAPCSGTGTLRRHPEIRWRLTPEGVARLAGVQAEMLRRAREIVRPGGRLIYSVCSLEREEGATQVERFVSDCPEFRPIDPRLWLPAQVAGLVRDDGFLRTSPVQDGMDGFFAAVLERRGG